jgi:starvation-inducible DNA-binding protein
MKNLTKSYKDKLNQLLSSYQIHNQNLRLLHWNIKGEKFFELHKKYEEFYNRSQVIIDELAERLLALGETPLSRYSEYLQHSVIAECPIISEGNRGVQYLINAQNDLMIVEKKLLKLSESHEDEGTNALISTLIQEKEKTNWMLTATMHKQTVEDSLY